MKTRKVYTLGETLLDIIFRNEAPIAAKPGGSMLNSAVSLGRTGIDVYFISDYGTDFPGNLISGFLEKNRVSTNYIDRYADGNTAIALASLDTNSNAEYTFYKSYPPKRLTAGFPEIFPGDVVLFGSFYAINADIREKIIGFIRSARQSGALIIYDPNFRKTLLAEINRVRPWIEENIALADIVRGSDEDFNLIFNTDNTRSAYTEVRRAGCNLLIYTANSQAVELMCDAMHLQVEVPPITPVSTIGAGDSFNAGLIYALIHKGIERADLPFLKEENWREMIAAGISFASAVCMQMDNYVPEGFEGGYGV